VRAELFWKFEGGCSPPVAEEEKGGGWLALRDTNRRASFYQRRTRERMTGGEVDHIRHATKEGAIITCCLRLMGYKKKSGKKQRWRGPWGRESSWGSLPFSGSKQRAFEGGGKDWEMKKNLPIIQESIKGSNPGDRSSYSVVVGVIILNIQLRRISRKGRDRNQKRDSKKTGRIMPKGEGSDTQAGSSPRLPLFP